VLSLEDGWAHCVGLPRAMWDRPADEQAMATSPDGSYLFVIDAGTGVVAAMNTGSLRVRTTALELPSAGAIDRTAAGISPDGETLFVSVAGDGGTVVTAVDASTFEVLDTWRMDGVVSGLGVSSDGASLYTALDGRLAVLDATSGVEIGGVTVPTDQPIVRVTPLAA
jgi:DNA-binding beta-propeller fold protein YncE